MANFSDARAIYGLQATGSLTSTLVSGSVQIGVNQTQVRFPNADVAYSLRAIFVGTGDILEVNLPAGSTSGSTAFVAGAAQVETATAAGTITAAGNASVVVTAAGMTGSPKTISVAVANTDTAATWAGKVRTALAADSAVSALFSVGGTTTAIVLTRKPTSSYTVPGGTLNLYAANDATLNIALDNGTCTGITTAGTSANTTAGVVSDGVKIYDGDGKDFEGETLVAIASINGVLFKGATGSLTVAGSVSDSFNVSENTGVQFFGSDTEPLGIDDSFTITATSTSDFTLTVIGQSV